MINYMHISFQSDYTRAQDLRFGDRCVKRVPKLMIFDEMKNEYSLISILGLHSTFSVVILHMIILLRTFPKKVIFLEIH